MFSLLKAWPFALRWIEYSKINCNNTFIVLLSLTLALTRSYTWL